MDFSNLKVGIIGAGIGGMTTALALSQKGFQVEIFEKLVNFNKAGVGIQISPNGMRVLNALGLEEKINKICTLSESVQFLKAETSHLITNIPMGKNFIDKFGAGFYQVHRTDLVNLLQKELLNKGIAINFGKQANVCKTSSISASLVIDKKERVYDVVVAADGVRSQTRSALFDRSKPVFLKQVAYRSIVCASKLPNQFLENNTKVFFGPGFHIVSYPLRKGSLVNFIFCLEQNRWSDEDWLNLGTKEELLSHLNGLNFFSSVIDRLDFVNKWGLFGRSALETWNRGRVVLLGDSCHPMLPYLAQGATQAIEDAWVLSENLDFGDHQKSFENKFRNYYQQRFNRVSKVQRLSANNRRLFHIRNPIIRFSFYCSLKLLKILWPNFLVTKFTWLYAGGAIPIRLKTWIRF